MIVGELPAGPVTPGIRASIEKALADQIPDGKRGVLLQVRGVQGDGVSFGLAARVGDGWMLAGDVEKRWGGPVAGTVSVARVW